MKMHERSYVPCWERTTTFIARIGLATAATRAMRRAVRFSFEVNIDMAI